MTKRREYTFALLESKASAGSTVRIIITAKDRLEAEEILSKTVWNPAGFVFESSEKE